MGITQLIAMAIKNGFDPVEALQDYLEEKDSRVTRAEAAGMVKRFKGQVGALIASMKNAQPIPPCTHVEVVEVAWFWTQKTGQASLAKTLETELRKRGALPTPGETNEHPGQWTSQI